MKHGLSGWITRLGGVLSGPAPLSLRLAAQISESRNLRRAACWAAIAGSLLTRYGWMQAGKASGRDWRLSLEEAPELRREPEKQQIPERKRA